MRAALGAAVGGTGGRTAAVRGAAAPGFRRGTAVRRAATVGGAGALGPVGAADGFLFRRRRGRRTGYTSEGIPAGPRLGEILEKLLEEVLEEPDEAVLPDEEEPELPEELLEEPEEAAGAPGTVISSVLLVTVLPL